MSDTVHLRRGNKLWQTSFMLPEHVDELKKLKLEESKVPPPLLDDQELYELGLIANDSLKHTLEIKVTHWVKGFYKEVVGIVESIDHQGERFKLSLGEDYTWIDIDKLKQIERV